MQRTAARRAIKRCIKPKTKKFTRAKEAMKESLKKMMHWDLKIQAKRLNAILRGHFNSDFQKVLNQHPLISPQLKIPYSKLAPYVRLYLLSEEPYAGNLHAAF